MTMPRRITPGDTWMVTRRTAQRMFLLRPEKTVNAIFEYCLAEAAARHGIVPIAWTVMSNHYHAIVHDPKGTLPAFLEQLHKMVAKCLNAHHGRWENFWSTEETCCTRLVTRDDILDKVVYVLTNPVTARLVDSAAQWPGATSWSIMGRKPVTRRRPHVFFKKEGSKMPEEVALRAAVPPMLKGAAASRWVSRVRDAVAARESELADERRKKNLSLVGRKNVLATNPLSAPKTSTRRVPRSAGRRGREGNTPGSPSAPPAWARPRAVGNNRRRSSQAHALTRGTKITNSSKPALQGAAHGRDE